jgi:zinc transporter ZupT
VSYTTLNIEEKCDIIDTDGESLEEKEKLSVETSDFGSAPSSYCEEFEKDARMVIVGDAIHNFADGLAIGAAFSISIAAGFSTRLAVLCHELPHEVGDFALLLHSGMPTKTAVLFNIVSSIFAVLGMVVGLLLGSSGQFSSWLLASTVGVFVYVALVSMMSEIGGGGLKNLILNAGGMVAGALLLLMIGLYEHDLIYLLGGDNH